MKCNLCATTPKNWEGDDRQCAFESGTFSTLNWNCATVNKLRDIAENYRAYGDDQSIATIPVGETKFRSSGWLIMNWYKDRGRTDLCQFISYGHIRNLNLKHAEEIIELYSPKKGMENGTQS
jgi:hypothetical protein